MELYTDSKAVQPETEEHANKCHIKASSPSKCEELCTDISNKDCISSKAMDGEHFQEGYNYVLVDESLQQDFQCSICHLIPSTPAKVSCCGLSCQKWSRPKVVPRTTFGNQNWSPRTTFGCQNWSRGTTFGSQKWSPLAKSGPTPDQFWQPKVVPPDQFWQPKVVPPDHFWQPKVVPSDTF